MPKLYDEKILGTAVVITGYTITIVLVIAAMDAIDSGDQKLLHVLRLWPS